MKGNASFLLLAASLVAATSCQKESLTEPQVPVGTHSDDARAKFVGKIYTLTKHGNAALSYDAAKRLKKVTYATGALSHVDYSYGIGFVKSVAYLRESGKASQESKYLLNAAGRCYEMQRIYHWYSGEWVSSELHRQAYEYDAQGRLVKSGDKDNPNQHIDCAYDADGNLVKATVFAPNTGLASKELAFGYHEHAGAPLVSDRYPLNPLWAGYPDEYLRVFGKTSKHLVWRMTRKYVPGGAVDLNRKYAYFFNADGYVTQQKWSDVGDPKGYMVPFEYGVEVVLP